MTFEELEDKLSNGFHDAKIERILVDYPSGTLRMSMKVLTGTPGEPDEENDGPIELIVGGLYFFSVELPDPTYQFKPNGKPLEVQGGKPELMSTQMSKLLKALPADASCYRFFVEPWNSFIYVCAADVVLVS